ncbi:MAG TPA: adenylate/guanylate cyclase domain-containing protein [Candidatus Limnocylindrales bacterium]
MICSNCGTENPAGTKFCMECATPLAVVCPVCGHANLPAAKFCGECATPLVGQAAQGAAASGAIAGSSPIQLLPDSEPAVERRLVSILFADLVGFTPYTEARDAEEVRDTLDRYFEIARNSIERHGGTVEKFIGDAVMAVWGAPVAREDDAERAVRAALELVDAVTPLGVKARAGVLTGEAAVNVGAIGEGMVVGDIVNTAARLQSVADPGTVLVGESTYRAASRAIAFEPAGDQTLKGKASPVAAWRALRVTSERGGRNRGEGLEAPFVGRTEELRLIKDLFHATGREGRVRLVSVMGPAGIGKTRLAREFLKYLDGLVDTVLWHDGRSPAYGEGITFWALGEMVRGRAGLLETDDERTTRDKITAVIAAHVADEAERRWIEPALLALLGLEAGARSDELFAAWRTFFERLAAANPVVLVFEDFHFADPGLIDFVDHLLDWSKGVPIYVVTLARLELLERRPNWGAGKRSFVSLALEPLPEPAMRELIGGLVPGLPERAIRSIVTRADGIPLYAVETVRMLVANGQLVRDDAAYRPIGDLSDLAVPETLTALITSRLDGLERLDRELMADAAVLGQSFTTAALAAVAALAEGDLEPRLRSLVRHELLTMEADPRSAERGQYAFVQALIREVAYNTIAKRDRKTRHLAAARFFEGLGSDELAGALAGHYLAAHRNAPDGPEADALAAQARIALRAAADRAVALGAHEQAVAFLEEAVNITMDRAERADLLERAGSSASMAGRHEAAELHLRRAIDLYRELGDRTAICGATASLGRVLISSRQTDVGETLLEAARAEFADLEAAPAGAAIGGQLARAAYLNGNVRRAIEIADPVLETAEHLDLGPIVADTLITKGSALAQLGRMTEGLALLRAGQDLAERHGLSEAVSRAMSNRAWYEVYQDPRSVLEMVRLGMVVAHRSGVRNPVIIGNGAYAALRIGEWTWAVTALEGELAEDLEPPDRSELLVWLTWFRALVGNQTDDLVAEILRLNAGATDIYRRLAGIWARAPIAFVAGRFREAHDDWRAAMDEFGSPADLPLPARAALWARDADLAREDLAAFDAAGVHGPPLEADRATIRAGIAALEGRSSDALGLYREALRAWRDLGMAWDEAQTGLDMATFLDPSEPEVRAAADAAREIFARLGARPFLERLDAAVGRAAAKPNHIATVGAKAIPTEV